MILSLACLLGLAQAPQALPVARDESAPAPALSARQGLEACERALANALLERRPWLLWERGGRRKGSALGRFGPEDSVWWTAVLEDAALTLAALEEQRLAPGERVRRDALEAFVHAEAILARSFANDRRDPVAYVEHVERTLDAIATSSRIVALERRAALAATLRAVPGLFEHAERALFAPTSVWCTEAAARLVGLGATIELGLAPVRISPKGPPEDEARLAAARSEAIAACAAFRQWLLAMASREGRPRSVLGMEVYTEILRASTGSRLDLASLRARALRELALLDRELGPQGPPVPARKDDLTRAAIAADVRATGRTAIDALHGTGLVSGSFPGARLDAELTVAFDPDAPLCRVRPGPKGQWTLLFAAAPRMHEEEWLSTRAPALVGPGRRALALRYGFPGEAFFRTLAARAGGGPRVHLWSETVCAGFASFAAEAFLRDDGPAPALAGDALLRRACARLRLLETARWLAAYELHAEGVGAAEVAATLRRRTGLLPQLAESEVRALAHDPTAGMGVVVLFEIRDREEGLSSALESGPALARIFALVSDHPWARPGDLSAQGFFDDLAR